MARDHARMKCSRWREEDWRALTSEQQHAYDLIVGQEQLSYCGVLTYAPAVLAELYADGTEVKMKRAVKGLEAARFVIVDQRTHELLVRSYVRHDGVLDRPNMGKATATAYSRVLSQRIRDAVLVELARYWREASDLSGWIGFKAILPEEFAVITDIASRME